MSATVFFSSANEIATLSNTFTVNGVPTDPGAATLTVTSPANVVSTFTGAGLTHGSAGVFSKDIPCNEAGTWSYQWDGTTTASDTTAGTWEVLETQVGHLYATVEALKSRLGNITSTADDSEFHAACFAASRAVEQECGRHFWRTLNTEARTFTPCGLYVLDLPMFCDLVSVTSLKTDNDRDGVYETTWTTGYQLLPVNPGAAPETRPYTKIRTTGGAAWPVTYGNDRDDSVQITGVFGWPSVPWGIKQAALILAADTFKLKDAPFGVQGFGDFGPVRVGTNRAVDKFLAPYRRFPVLAA